MVKSLGRTFLHDRNEASIKVLVRVEFIMGTLSNFGVPELVLVISPSPRLEIMHQFFFFFLDSLLFEEFSNKI